MDSMISESNTIIKLNEDLTFIDASQTKYSQVKISENTLSSTLEKPKANNSLGKTLGVIIGVILLVVILGAVFQFEGTPIEVTEQISPEQPTSHNDEFIFEKYINQHYGYCIEYPSRMLFPSGESENGDGQSFNDRDNMTRMVVYRDYRLNVETGEESDLASAYQEDTRTDNPQYPSRIITYKRLLKKFFVISGYNHGKIFYQKTIINHGELATAKIEYPESKKEYFNIVSEKIFNSFKEVE